ncbi:MAG: DUF4038 domain-containing protein [Planctomycetaceae bacterium]
MLIRSSAFVAIVALVAAHSSAADFAKWRVFETSLTAANDHPDPLAVECVVAFTSPTEVTTTTPAFWDGDRTWRVRFSPGEQGTWHWKSACEHDKGLDGATGTFESVNVRTLSPIGQDGPVRLSEDRTHFVRDEGDPFFWLADTAWNGVLRSKPDDWNTYLKARRKQGFTAIQFVATQWRGGREVLPFKVFDVQNDRLTVDTDVLRDLDAKVAAINDHNLVAVPVMLWALREDDPGQALSEAHAVRLAKYLKARWGAYDVIWFLGGDGPYKDVERWKRIGRAVFPQHETIDSMHRLATLHPSGQNWVVEKFVGEPWYDFIGYQSGHGASERELKWLTTGPPARQWKKEPTLPIVNIEPNYEGHPAYGSGKKFTDHEVRRAAWWSLLIAPPAGVTYGNNEIWVWNEQAGPAENHGNLRTVEPWHEGLESQGIASMTILRAFFESGPWTTLRPAQDLLAEQPGKDDLAKFVAAAKSNDGSRAVLYLPVGGTAKLRVGELESLNPTWFDPRTGERSPVQTNESGVFTAPDDRDWVLEFRQEN